MIIINLCPHPVTLYDNNGLPVIIPESKHVARIINTYKFIGLVNNIPVYEKTNGKILVSNGFRNDPRRIYIVSTLVKQHPDCPENFYSTYKQNKDRKGKNNGSNGLIGVLKNI
ncbi:hypothetical protein LA345_23475 [Burkholderia vietnamiensis]|nr:hypothetical protein [Burkholderia vietnamiensis]